ncbi:hypothetical protein NM688_g7088 [Phlebia brevispora]|uniref:Uncharacterized protein n=1 Tax=Phlebia brevispora TaxID=194682 RepID=A0ACC1S9P1_9APHY|nr:hypothetical protein NM688_g7088 [Phlebia brevispora]
MKAAKEKRSKGRALAKERRRAKSGSESTKLPKRVMYHEAEFELYTFRVYSEVTQVYAKLLKLYESLDSDTVQRVVSQKRQVLYIASLAGPRFDPRIVTVTQHNYQATTAADPNSKRQSQSFKAMFIAIVGTQASGKATVEDFLVKEKEFIPIRLISKERSEVEGDSFSLNGSVTSTDSSEFLQPSFMRSPSGQYRPVSFLLMNSPVTPSFPSLIQSTDTRNLCRRDGELVFYDHKDLLEHVTQHWRSDFVTTDLNTRSLLEMFVTRPFFMIVSVDAPIFTRYERIRRRGQKEKSLEDFIREHDVFFYGPQSLQVSSRENPIASPQDIPVLRSLNPMVNVRIINSFETIPELYEHLEELDLINPDRLRPGWDTYFMQLASLASLRSNCMKRRVGAILVRNKRILSTGYNGTPRGLTNCNEGGCSRCNSASESSDECVCLHAEENALLEAGRERVGDGAVIYCNTCPCLKCTIKIIQTGVKEVVYNLSYKVDDASAELFREAGVLLRRHAPPPEF